MSAFSGVGESGGIIGGNKSFFLFEKWEMDDKPK